MKRMATATAVSLVMGVGLLTGTAQALETKIVVVDCATQSLQALLDSVPRKLDFAAVVVIKGTCAEDVTLEFFDDVTFKGHPAVVGTISGTLTIVGARRVVIDNLTVTGPGDGIVGTDGATFTVQNSNISNNAGNGIVGTDGASFTVQNSDISNNDRSGIEVLNGSSATVFNNTIHDNGVNTLNFAVGIKVVDGSSADIIDNDIQNSLFEGVFVAESSSARLQGNTINNSGTTDDECGVAAEHSSAVRLAGGNTITNSSFAAICVGEASAIDQGLGEEDIITQVGGATRAVWVGEDSSAFFQNANITGVIEAWVLSAFDAEGGSITGDIIAFGNSGVQVSDPATFNGTLFCSTGTFSFGEVGCGQTCSGDVPGTCVP